MLIDVSRSPSRRELCWFAGVWFPALCGVLGWLTRDVNMAVAAGLWIAGAVLGLAGLARPSIIKPVYVALIRLTFPIGWVASHVMMLVMYYLVVTPVGLLVRLFHDPLDRAFDAQAQTYWIKREPSPRHRYFRQF